MSRPVDGLLRVPADFLALSAVPPIATQGQLTCSDSHCTVELPQPMPLLAAGTRVVVASRGEQAFRVLGTVASHEGTRVRIKVGRVVPADQRAFPRMVGGITLRYRVLPPGTPDDTLRAWMETGEAQGEWRQPDPFMDFSGSGLAFEDSVPCSVGDKVLVQFLLPTYTEWWRATAHIVRAQPAAQAPDTVQDIAIHFIDLPPGALDALMQYTLRMQSVYDGEE